jgi:hypothetical protein
MKGGSHRRTEVAASKDFRGIDAGNSFSGLANTRLSV